MRDIVIDELYISLKLREDKVLLNSGLYTAVILIEDQSLVEC